MQFMFRQRTAPYPPQISVPVVDSPDLSDQRTTEAILRDSQTSEHPVDPSSATCTKTNSRFVRFANHDVSGSAAVYTSVPYTMDVEDPHPERPDHRTSNPIVGVEPHEDPPSDGLNGAAQGVMTAGVKPPAPRDVSVAADDDGVATLAKKILEYYKEAGMNLGIGSETIQEER